MKFTVYKIFLILLTVAILLNACSDDDSMFGGGDNYISAFQLKKGDKIYNAQISLNTVTISVTENITLTDAEVSITISENASIEPDPLSISDWENEHTFTVTSYNGNVRVYQYKAEKTPLSTEGNIVLATQAEVDALAALNLSEINGMLTIGSATGTDSVYSLAGLSTLKSIQKDLFINPTFAGKNLTGLENIETVGSVNISNVKTLETVSFPALKSVITGITIAGGGIKVIDFPELKKVDWNLQLSNLDSVSTINFDKLETVLTDIQLQGTSRNTAMRRINFPHLTAVGGNITVASFPQLQSVQFPALQQCLNITMTSLNNLEAVEFNNLQTVEGTINLSYNSKLSTIQMSELKTISGNFNLQSVTALENLDGLQSLHTIGGDLYLYSLTNLNNVNGLKNLETVGNNVTLSYFTNLEDEDLQGLSSLKHIGGDLSISVVPFRKFSGFSLSRINSVSINGNSVSTIEEIDLSNVVIENRLSLTDISTPVVVKGADVFDATLSVSSSNVTLKGFTEIKNFTFYYVSNTAEKTFDVRVKRVTGDFSLTANYLDKISFNQLEEVGGKTSISITNNMELEFPQWKKTGTLDIQATLMDAIHLPALQLIDGDCSILTANYQGSTLAEIDMPLLSTINGTLKIYGYSSYYTNTRLANLNGLSALSKVNAVTISFNNELSDYTGLKNIVNAITEDDWNVSNNKYNPTYNDMLNGKYVFE